MSELCSFYTNSASSELLIAELDSSAPRRIVDLGAGSGSLSVAAQKRWEGARFSLVDVDTTLESELQAHFPQASYSYTQADLLRTSLPPSVKKWVAKADIVLCNPPFKSLAKVETESPPATCRARAKWPNHIAKRAEVAFLDHMLQLLKPGGELAIILPGGFATGLTFRPFRQWLLETLSVRKVIELPPNAFAGADVRTFVFVARKILPKETQHIELVDASQAQAEPRRHWIPNGAGVVRLDLAYHLLAEPPTGTLTLGQLGVKVSRGWPVTKLRLLGIPFFHTTDFSNPSTGIASTHGELLSQRAAGVPCAARGDLLLGRIGRSCHNQATQVQIESMPFSDCVFRLETPAQHAQAVKASLLSSIGARWRASRLRGTTVSLLSKADLLEHPVWPQTQL